MGQPPQRLIRTFLEAEELAAEWMRWMGFDDARVTAPGADEGIDVFATGALAQVKFEGLPSGRPVVQALYGIAAARSVPGLFFSLAGWTADAIAWADRVELALFRFTHDGSITPANLAAEGLFQPGAEAAIVSPDALGNGGQTRGGAAGTMAFAAPFTGVEGVDDIHFKLGCSPYENVITDGRLLYWGAEEGVYRASPSEAAEARKLMDASYWVGSVAVAGDSLFSAPNIDPAESAIQCLDVGTLECRWSSTIPLAASQGLFVTSSAVIVTGHHSSGADFVGGVWCYSPTTGRLRWQTDLPRIAMDKPAVAASYDYVFVGGADEKAKVSSNGTWRLNPQAVPFGSGAMLDAKSGQLLWMLGDRAVLAAAISGRVALLTVAEPDPWWTGYIAFDCVSGRELWRVKLELEGAPLWLPPWGPVLGNRHAWLPGWSVVCCDLVSGDQLWSAGPSGNIIWSKDRVLCYCRDDDVSMLYTLDPLTGETIDEWRLPVGNVYDHMLWLSERMLAFSTGTVLSVIRLAS